MSCLILQEEQDWEGLNIRTRSLCATLEANINHFGISYTQNHVPAAPSMIAGQRQHSNAHW